MKNRLLIICGKASSGKDVLTRMISDHFGIPILVSHTTRDKRSNETDGLEYHFISEEEFQDKLSKGEFLEYTTYDIQSENRTYYYGLSKGEAERYPYSLVIMNPYGINQLLSSSFKDKLEVILIDCNDRERLIRYLLRDKNVNVEECIDRYFRDKQDFDNPNFKVDYIVTNDTILEKAFMNLRKIVTEIMSEDCI